MNCVHRIRPSRGSFRSALTIVEAAISTLIVGVMLVAALNTVGAAYLGRARVENQGRGMLLAQQLVTEILQQAYVDPEAGWGSFGLGGDEVGDGSRSLWEDVDDYYDWSASPPQYKDGTVITGFDDWERSSTVAWVTDADLEQSVGYETGIKRIVVSVSRDGVPIATLVAYRTYAWDASDDE